MEKLRTVVALGVSGWLLMMPSVVKAQGYLTDGHSANAVLTRDPARQASTEIDAVVTNPAGTAFLADGMHISLSGVGTFGSYTGESEPYKMSNTRITPAIQLAYKVKRWTASASYAIEGGFGRRSSDQGGMLMQKVLPSLEQSVWDDFKNTIEEVDATLILIRSFLGEDCLADANNSLSVAGRFTSKCYNNAIRVGASYRITDYLSVYGGVKVNHTSFKNTSSAQLGVIQASDDTFKKYSEYFGTMGDAIVNANVDEDIRDKMQDVVNQAIVTGDVMQRLIDFIGNSTKTGWGIAPVLGVDVKTKHINFGAKYDFATRIHFKGASRSYVPALLSIGADWKAAKRWNVAVGTNIVFTDKTLISPMGLGVTDMPVAWNISASTTYRHKDKWLFSVGYTYEDFNEATADMVAQAATVYNCRISLGAAYNVMKNLQINAGVSGQLIPATCTLWYSNDTFLSYKRSPQVQVALGANYSF